MRIYAMALELYVFYFQINAGIVRDLATGIAETAPKAFVLVISNPVNSTVPIVAEVFKKHGVFDPKRFVNNAFSPINN
jgi:malate/lactate dehydrogenase